MERKEFVSGIAGRGADAMPGIIAGGTFHKEGRSVGVLEREGAYRIFEASD